MSKTTILDIYKAKKAANKALFNTQGLIYPDNPEETSTANFLTDYAAIANDVDLFTVRLYGQRYFQSVITDDESEIINEWDAVTKSILTTHLPEWARLYYALSLKYNPIWNVDGTTTTVYGETSRTDSYAEREDVTNLDSALTTSTDYATAYDSGTEKETGKNTLNEPERENTVTYGAHLDTYTTEEYTDTETRSGNIGVTSTQSLLSQSWELSKRSFFDSIVKTIIDEAGCFYGGC